MIHRGFIGVGYDGGQNVRDEELPVDRKEPNRKQGEQAKQSRWGFRGMTVRDWLQLLIVPLALVVIGFLFSVQQDARQQRIENQRAEAERELAEQRAQDEALQAYLSQMGSLLLEKDLRESAENSEVRTLARARTLTVLGRLDPSRKTAVMQFLVEADLVQRVDEREPIIRLNGADLSGAYLLGNLRGADLEGADLSGAKGLGADLIRAALGGADLRDAYLPRADLSGADILMANLARADLSGADLEGADLRDAHLKAADLSNANLSDALLDIANLSGANLGGASLSGASLRWADLSDAAVSQADLSGAKKVTNEQLRAASSLKGATMPNGQKYEDWLKDN